MESGIPEWMTAPVDPVEQSPGVTLIDKPRTPPELMFPRRIPAPPLRNKHKRYVNIMWECANCGSEVKGTTTCKCGFDMNKKQVMVPKKRKRSELNACDSGEEKITLCGTPQSLRHFFSLLK